MADLAHYENKKTTFKQRVQLWLLRHTLSTITTVLGIILTLIIVVTHCLIVLVINKRITYLDMYLPLISTTVFLPCLVVVVNFLYGSIERDREELHSLQKKESALKNSLARTYITIINQREKNCTLSKDHAKLRGTLDSVIEKRNEAETKLDEQVSFFSATIELSPDIIIYRNLEGKIIGCNDNLLRLLGAKSREEVVQLLNSNAQLKSQFFQNDEAVIASRSDCMYETTINGIVYQMRKRPAITPKGAMTAIITYGHDITKLKNEQDLLEKTSREKSTFISTLSHELRTPLNGIVGLSDILLQNGHFHGLDERHLKAINVSAVTLGNIFNDVIDLNKMERRTFVVTEEPVKWPDFIDDLETLATLMTEQKNLSFTFKKSGEIPALIETDPTRLRQILWNLIGNATKFTKKGGVTVEVHNQIVGEQVKVSFVISDTGIGIPQEEHDKIFGLYYQVAGTKQSTGTGIGLHVTRNYVDAFHGTIELESEVGKGTTFTLHFTFAIVPEKHVEEETVNRALRVLLVEDVDLNILVAKTMLEKLGHIVSVAKTGKETLEIFKNGTFDLVLLDMQLPDMNGLQIADHLIADYHSTVPMIALTANVVNTNQVYTDHHIEGVMSKPLTASKLAATLKQYQGKN